MSSSASRHDVEVLYRRHADELHGYLYRRAGSDGTDLLSDVFVVALQRVNDLPEPDLRRAWLFATARRLLLASARGSRKREGAEVEQARLYTTGEDGPDELTERVTAVREALACLREP
ncbi:RNA polymerase sigma factor, partial [Nocardioides sp.]|uniref:RNA polymerase sigma factor n=1 Tax=Nocardioides sp. TaxID=35761 RepID=UPI002B2783C7